MEHNIQDFSTLQKFGSFHQNARSLVGSSNLHNFGVVITPQKVNSLAELMDFTHAKRAPQISSAPNISTGVVRPTGAICQHSPVEGNQVAHTFGTGFLQDHLLHCEGGRGLQEMSSRLSVGNYNLNLPTRPEAGECSSSVLRSFPFWPVTPDPRKLSKTINHQSTEVPRHSVHETLTQAKCTQNNISISLQPGYVFERNYSENNLINPPSESAAVILTSPNEVNNCDGENLGIDLNQTPQPRPPKRKKHRPKVVIEGKPKRTPKPPSANTHNGIPRVKRKYVRKNGIQSSETPAANVVKTSKGRPPKKSSKRKLDFDLENGEEKKSEEIGEFNCQAQRTQEDKFPFNLNLADHRAELDGPMTSIGDVNTHGRKKHHGETEKDFFVHSMNKVALQESLLLENMGPLPPKPRDHTLNVIARCLNMQYASTNPSIDVNRYSQVNHCVTNGGLGQSVIQSNTFLPNAYYNSRQSNLSTMPQLVQDLIGVTEIQGTEKLYTCSQMRHPLAISLMGSQFWSNEVSKMGHSNRDSRSLRNNGLYTGQRMNDDKGFHGTSSCVLPSVVTTGEQYFAGQIGRSKILRSGVSETCDNRGQSISINPAHACNKVARDWYMNIPDFRHKFQQQQVNICSERVAEQKTYHMPCTERRNNAPDASVTNFINRNVGFVSQRELKPIPVNDNTNSADLIAVRKQNTAGQTSSNKRLQEQEQSKNKRSYRSSGSVLQEESRFSIDYITNLFKDLHINNDAQHTLVPYRGDGAVVPYEEFDIVKKQQARPRVDLDPETNRLWNLLMGKDGGVENMDSDKQKWWEEERKVVRGRVDSFIARMHLVQGDRRFSKWKGSVVDSVIGVFLTQNVSDHLSSSAFMSLAAKFPLKSTTVCCENGDSPLIEHHEVRITHPDGTSYAHKILREPVYNHSSVTSTTLQSECGEKNVTTEERTLSVHNHTKKTQDFILSQSSSESIFFKSYEDIRSSSGSNSETEDGCNLSKNLIYRNASEQVQQYQDQCMGSSHPYNGPLFGHQQLENAANKQNEGLAATNTAYHPYPVLPSANYWPSLSFGLDKWEEDVLAFLGTESVSTTLASTHSVITNGTGLNHPHDDHIGQSSESIFTCIQDGGHKFQQSPVNNNIATPYKHSDLKIDLSDESANKNDQHVLNIHMESRIQSDPTGPDAEPLSTQTSDICQKHADDTSHEPTKMGGPLNSFHKQTSNMSSTTPNARKKKVEKKTVESFDWDSLRKKVLSNDLRSRKRMDSLDYEALRKTDVREISDTIKERGMNNMLAERMKSFLNRLVKDHERIDLEWLRDVEPDKAKDYLLSIRGLGLKSVECVRLLTLHHLAFPVDTNVGRIAVRLGWVPLQPLPESLQLHLLELYPVLESIQKYLWPRLCKLDQETLYELHYQMITFGKVFCTKREPNCNACPMRGECRHFASAFASARLTLPGPEEKRIVSSDPPVAPNKRPDVIIKHLPPLISSGGSIESGGLTGSCLPLIEEPTTPEPAITEVSERDIEDAFNEDPDEIPVIKLNVQEFTTNLQSFMQEQMEMGEADMSKALVSLSPDLASIPIPKLKLVNRLRTEHRVYELPDSHPLLNGMEGREPDDPSPYLLAIWTPGETVDSVQPPESTCSSQEGGGLCNNRTCFSCNSTREAHAQTVRGTILIPCRTAMRGSFPLNGTYFQVNEVFADHESSLNPIDVPRSSIWNLPRRTVFFGTSVSSIFKGLPTEDIQYCFWKGFVCVRGFDQKCRAPRPLRARLHLPPSKVAKQND